RLVEVGLAKFTYAEHDTVRMINLTAFGIAVMKGEQPPPNSLADLMPRHRAAPARGSYRVVSIDAESNGGPLNGEEAERFDKLRHLRLQLARDKQLPPYCICHDSTLKLIARQAPADLH